ncbi:putative enoyl-CoA hydratase [Caenibius tardaugens NBRC 16725]|uniref:Putative enoyl-CoA hydratase n=1 Tax=Caenibius tardaugens NBRC 16725 TaxID=1219035 RepID=U2ZZ47_9SPHN|nr:enoyl-CoA hydratase-related protein [Caenibius tardaugens]AZI36992.1 2-(1,2-epoxy-1,2-dihydrophenyl)acetyl-CoA isomerase [Caenibius tardaugens NBRC 16725]GAD47788.1 putative enoyl-CoA hydratase [Caenibius tardaugens NBRC 16725]
MNGALVTYALADGVARIALNDPATLNAASEAMGMELLAALRRAGAEARAVILTGEGRAFCSGANLDDAAELIADPLRDGGAQLERTFNPVIEEMRRMTQPVVVALRGAVAGVGCGIAMAGDIILCSENAYFFFAFPHVGLVPDGGSSWLLSKAIGRVRAMRLMLLGEKLAAADAFDWGLISRIVPDAALDEEAQTLARNLASGPHSLALIKQLAWKAQESDLAEALAAERIGQCEAGRSEDFIEGMQAFRERRKPVFKGR